LEDPALLRNKAVMSAFLRGGLQPPSIPDVKWGTMNKDERLAVAPLVWKHLSASSSLEDRITVLQILAFPNMLEGLASMYNQNLLEASIVKTRVEFPARNFWEASDWWVAELRLVDEHVFKDIEVMLRSLQEQKRPSSYNE
jgi:hypothetical protein